MDLHYTITEISREDTDARRTKIQKVLPQLKDLVNICRQEIAVSDLHPYVNWAEGVDLTDKFYEFDFVVVLKRRHEYLGFAFVSINGDKSSLNVDMICASQMGRVVMQGIFALADFLNFEKITLQAVPNVYGFYRNIGFKTFSENSRPSPLDKLWDDLTSDIPKEGKPLSFSNEHMQKQMATYNFLDKKKSFFQSSEHKILRSLFVHKRNKNQTTTTKDTMTELLQQYEAVLKVYDAITDALAEIPRTKYDQHIPMEIEMTSISIGSLPAIRKDWDLKSQYDPEEAMIDAMGNSSEEDMNDEGMNDEDCAPTPTRYRTFAGPNLSCPAEALALEEGKKCCTSRPEASEGYPNPPSHPDSLRFLLALRTVYTSSDSPDNIPVELQRTMKWINDYQASNMIHTKPSDDPILFVPVKSTWLVTILKFAAMSLCNTTIAVYVRLGYRELYRKCHDGGACVNLYTDMKSGIDTLKAINEVGVKRAKVYVANADKIRFFKLPFVNALEVEIVGQESLPVKMDDVLNFILRGSLNSKPALLALNRSFISNTEPHRLFAEMMKRLPFTCGRREIRFATSTNVGESPVVEDFLHTNIVFEYFMDLVAHFLDVAPPITRVGTNGFMTSSIEYNDFMIMHGNNNVIVIARPDNQDVGHYNMDKGSNPNPNIQDKGSNPNIHKKKHYMLKYVSQHTLDGKLLRTYKSASKAAKEVEESRYNLIQSINDGRELAGFRWTWEGEPLGESRKVDQYTLNGEFVKTWTSMGHVFRSFGLRTHISRFLRRKIEDGGEWKGYRWAWHDSHV